MSTEALDIEVESDPLAADYLVYDFSHPQHRLGEPDTVLTVSGGKLATQLSALVDTVLHVPCEISLASVEFKKHKDLLQTLDKNVCIFQSELNPQSVEALILFDRDLILDLVASYFGGGKERTRPPAMRGLSSAERRLADRMQFCVTDVMQTVWGDSFSVDPTHARVLSAEELVHTVSEQSVVCTFRYSVKCNDNEAYFTIALPWTAVKTISVCNDSVNTNNDIEKRKWCTRLQENLEQCHVSLHGKLTETELTVEQLFSMQVGDFIPLGDPGSTTFIIDNTPVFEAEIGASNGLVSASILRWLNQGE